MKDYFKILNEIIEAYYNNEWPEYFEDDVDKIFKREGIIKGYKAGPTKHGRWVVKSKSIKDIPTEACSECGMWSYGDDMNYCPNCGAKMDEVEE